MPAHAQNRIGTGRVDQVFKQHCAVCHGQSMEGGIGGSLLEGDWARIGKDRTFLDYVKRGDPDMGMPAFEATLSDKEIRALEVYIDEAIQRHERAATPLGKERDGVYEAGGYRFRVETVVDGLSTPWAIEFLPRGGFLVTERPGGLRVFRDGRLSEPVEATPKVWARGQGGLLDVTLDPDYRRNAWVYLAYSHEARDPGAGGRGMTKVVRGRIIDHQWMDQQVIFEAPSQYHSGSGAHFGTRIIFQDGYLFFAIGDRGAMHEAQDLSRPNGKVHRIFPDGRVPEDNPFADESDAYPTIWTYGNRNIQGMAIDPATGRIWAAEHGPRGGDEVNLIEPGLNYGWPVVTHGINYNGTPITAQTSHPDMEDPKLHWTPSIAVCGITFYQGDRFPGWKGNLFAGGLASQELHRLVIDDTEVVSSEIVLKGIGRIRDVATGPDGAIYLVLNGPDRVVRLVPEE